MMKKVFYISFGMLVLTLIFLGAYNFAFKSDTNNPVADQDKKEQKGIATDIAESLSKPLATQFENPINELVLGAVIGTDGMVYYYSMDDKSIKKASQEGKNKETLLSNLPGEPTRILWSPKRDKALVQMGAWYYVNFSNRSLVLLKPEISRLVWNNLGDKVFYQYTDQKTGERSLNMSNPDGSDWKQLADLGTQETYLAAIPQSTSVSFWTRPNALEKTTFETVSISGSDRRTVLTDRFGADYLWSPDGSKVLVSTSNQKGGNTVSLNIMNSSGGEYQSLSIPTFVSKAVWSKNGKMIYYALPGSLPENGVMPNDYFGKSVHTKDTFWKLDLDTGRQTRLVELKDVTQSFDSTDLFISPDEDYLYFTDRVSHRLYRIEL
jgi:hypothetical protein